MYDLQEALSTGPGEMVLGESMSDTLVGAAPRFVWVHPRGESNITQRNALTCHILVGAGIEGCLQSATAEAVWPECWAAVLASYLCGPYDAAEGLRHHCCCCWDTHGALSAAAAGGDWTFRYH